MSGIWVWGGSHVWYSGEGAGPMSGIQGEGVPMSQCIMGNVHMGTTPPTEWQTDTCESITFRQLRLRAVIMLTSWRAIRATE